MFAHSDRMPTGTPLPAGTVTPRPWGVRRMVPYPLTTAAHARTDLDPTTQTTRYYGLDGVLMQAPAHGTSSGTNPTTNTGQPSDGSSAGGNGNGDSDTGNDTDQ
ncbi:MULTISPECIES: putative ATP-grasp-modified RiPP [unclassified Streptomyces]|uniref:putative ATP-grasp-modified RiPP n=1 Tax=unclassified Streptomyces TaxID=2593676 RepID=UPI00081E5A1C|nr:MULTISPECIES: putative ATP-grasp-modified RiPP [unclassified Streptomyces]MYZ37985.1 putative ATP-grasp-modified RiPP [Streptomyces sp. SID4917]SCF95505.1 putative ATP-grasp target RiPP [Streptomyces sp. MnatMP-M17]